MRQIDDCEWSQVPCEYMNDGNLEPDLPQCGDRLVVTYQDVDRISERFDYRWLVTFRRLGGHGDKRVRWLSGKGEPWDCSFARPVSHILLPSMGHARALLGPEHDQLQQLLICTSLFPLKALCW